MFVCHVGEFSPPEPRCLSFHPALFCHLSLINSKQADFLLINTEVMLKNVPFITHWHRFLILWQNFCIWELEFLILFLLYFTLIWHCQSSVLVEKCQIGRFIHLSLDTVYPVDGVDVPLRFIRKIKTCLAQFLMRQPSITWAFKLLASANSFFFPL